MVQNHMRNVFLTTFIWQLVFVAVSPQPFGTKNVYAQPKLNISHQTKLPKLSILEKKYDFGDITPRQTVSHIFELCNEGTIDLVIQKVKSNCGCTIAKPIGSTVSPGSKTGLEITFTAGDNIGPTEKKIAVYTNDPKQSLIFLSVTANIKSRVQMTPRTISCGKIPIGVSLEKKVLLKRINSSKPIKIKQIISKFKSISAKVIEDTNEVCEISVTINPNKVGEVVGTLNIIPEDNTLGIIKLPVRAIAGLDFLVNPKGIFWGTVKPGQQITRTITVGVPASDKLEKLSFSGGNGNKNIQIVSQPDGENKYKVQITWTPKEDSKNLLYHLLITAVSSNGIVEKIDVPCYGLIAH